MGKPWENIDLYSYNDRTMENIYIYIYYRFGYMDINVCVYTYIYIYIHMVGGLEHEFYFPQ